MLSGRGATACMALVAMLLLFAMPTTTGAAVAAQGKRTTSYIDYFLGDLFQNIDRHKHPKSPPRFRPWKIFDVPGNGVLAFDCAGDVPTLRLVPGTDHVDSSNSGKLPQDTCGSGPEAAGTPLQYKFGRKDTAEVYSVLFWSSRPGGEKEEEGSRAPPMPVPKLQLKAIVKALAMAMETAWRDEKGEAIPESVPFPADTVAFYFKKHGCFVIVGREDVEFRKPWASLDGKIRALTLGAVV